jgi:hypothetical protein
MANKSGNAYGLTVLCPILPGLPKQAPDGMNDQTHTDLVRLQLQRLPVNELSPMARVPNTYLSRLWVLDDVPFQGRPAVLEHLKSNYLVFSSNFHGELDDYLRGMWSAIEPEIRAILKYCVGFNRVTDVATFVDYVKRCQVETTFFFNGSSDEPLAVQLKSLYLKQELAKFAAANQGKSAADLQAAFKEFVARVQPANLEGPTWKPGAYHLDHVVLEVEQSPT